MAKQAKPATKNAQTIPYQRPEAKSLLRPEVGTQAQFKKKKPPKTYRYDSSLSPALDWDGWNLARGKGEEQLSVLSPQLSEIREKLSNLADVKPGTDNRQLRDNLLKKALKGEYEESVWDHLSGTISAPFKAGEHKQIAVKVIDDRGHELLVVKKLA
ncbi:MAG: hypothetical protein NNA20_07155 [Nitrospira sp.]|nr:hypothetical protein [Nitrospira sp.]MCP9442355.1 hypothetical protein [Nitrospira sp.]